MKTLSDLLLLGDPRLYQTCDPIREDELPMVMTDIVPDLHTVMQDVRAKYGFGRAIAAPQLGYMKRVVYMNISRPVVFINPVFSALSDDLFELWDDCMSFPNLLVRVKRHRSLTVTYRDEHWQEQVWNLTDDLAELLQHEVDHLDGVLCTMQAVDERAFRWRR